MHFQLKYKVYFLDYLTEFNVLSLKFNNDLIEVEFDNDGILSKVFIDNKTTFLMENTGLKDVNSREVYTNEIYKDNNQDLYRIYKTIGGFGISLKPFPSTFRGFDQYFLESLSERQMISWFESHCVYDGNIFDEKYKSYNLIY